MAFAGAEYALGSDDAPLTLVEFADYQCPFCRYFHTMAFQQVKRNYIDTGKLRFVNRDLPLDIHSHALKAAVAARCAGVSGKYWEMRQLLIEDTDNLNDTTIASFASQLQLDNARFQACLADEQVAAAVKRDADEARALGIDATPTFVLGRVHHATLEGVEMVGSQPYTVFEAEINKMLADQAAVRNGAIALNSFLSTLSTIR